FPGKAILQEPTMCCFNQSRALNALRLLKTKSSIGKQERKLNRSALFTRRWLIYWVWSSAKFVIETILRLLYKSALPARKSPGNSLRSAFLNCDYFAKCSGDGNGEPAEIKCKQIHIEMTLSGLEFHLFLTKKNYFGLGIYTDEKICTNYIYRIAITIWEQCVFPT